MKNTPINLIRIIKVSRHLKHLSLSTKATSNHKPRPLTNNSSQASCPCNHRTHTVNHPCICNRTTKWGRRLITNNTCVLWVISNSKCISKINFSTKWLTYQCMIILCSISSNFNLSNSTSSINITSRTKENHKTRCNSNLTVRCRIYQ